MISRAKIFPLLWLAMLLMFVGCNGRLSLIKDAFRFYNSTFSFPEKMLCIENGDTATVSITKLNKPLLIRYYGPDECSDCALNHMRDNIRLANYSKEIVCFDFVVILAPPKEDFDYVVEKAKGMSMPICIYIDYLNQINIYNRIPAISTFHFFLLDLSFIPRFLGDPLHNDDTRLRFEEILSDVNPYH